MRTVVICLVLLLVGCAKAEPLRSTSQLAVVEGAETLPPPSRGDMQIPEREALIGPLDRLDISVFNIPELDREIQVDAGGRIAMPIVGAIDAAGKTAAEVSTQIEAALRRNYVRNPQVTVNLKNSVSQVVTVEGQVVEPGLYPVTGQTTLIRTIASARGLTEFAKLDDVVIMRTVDGQRIAGLYNMTAIRRGMYADPLIYANDVVIVGDSAQRRRFKDLISLAPLLASPLIAIVQGF